MSGHETEKETRRAGSLPTGQHDGSKDGNAGIPFDADTSGTDCKPTVRRIELSPLDSPENIAKVLAISPRQVRRMCASGELEAIKLGALWRVNSHAALAKFGLA